MRLKSMESIIIYGSQYGTTRFYAEKLSELTGINSISYDKKEDISGCKLVIYLGGLYAGGVKGLKRAKKYFPESAKLILITVGLADPADSENVKNIRVSLQKQLPENIYKNARIFHLRGGIDYKQLTLKHRTMMRLLYNSVKNTPLEKMTEETKAMIDTYNKQVNFIDERTLNPIVNDIVKILSGSMI